MTKDTYLELGKTAEGRAKAHDLMVDEIREKMDDLALSVAPTKQAKVKALFDKALRLSRDLVTLSCSSTSLVVC